MSTKHDLSDPKITFDLASRLLRSGYYAVPTCALGKGKSWITPQGPDAYPTHEPRPDGQAPSLEYVEGIFRDNPGCGISVATPWLRPPHQNTLLVLDVDIEDHAVLPVVASIIGTPCPVRFGSKGGAFFVRYPAMQTLPAMLRDRDLTVPVWCKPAGITVPAYKALGSNHGIDFMGLKNAHVIIPPTVHMLASQAQQMRVEYEWRPFPGTDIVMRLEDTPPQDLPELQPYHMLLLYQWAKNPTSAIWKYIGHSSPGDHHGLMLSASKYMWHEKFTLEEIEAICQAEAERSSESDDKARDRFKEIATAVRTLQRNAPEQKPARQGRQGSSQAEAKIPLQRLMADGLVEQYGLDNLAYFGLEAYHWNLEKWAALTDALHPGGTPWHETYRQLMRNYPHADDGHATSAIRTLSKCIPKREAAPNHGYIPFRNGLLDVSSMRLRPMVRDDYILHSIPWDWDPDATCPLWDRFMEHLFEPPLEFHQDEPEVRAADRLRASNAVEEFFGYCLTRSHAYQRMLYVIGKPDTGKSVLFKVLKAMLPSQWMSTVSMDAFGDPNSRLQMVNSYINVASEVGRRSKDVDDVLLRVTAGEDVEIKVLYANKVQAVLPTRLVFFGNLPPDTTDGTGAIQRRILMIRTTDIVPNKVDEYERILLREAPGILRKLAMAYSRLLDRGNFEPPLYAAQITERMRIESNSTLLWMDLCCDPVDNKKEGTINSALFASYREWCETNKMFCLSMVQWGKQLTGAGFMSYGDRVASGYVQVRKLKLKNAMSGVSY